MTRSSESFVSYFKESLFVHRITDPKNCLSVSTEMSQCLGNDTQTSISLSDVTVGLRDRNIWCQQLDGCMTSLLMV